LRRLTLGNLALAVVLSSSFSTHGPSLCCAQQPVSNPPRSNTANTEPAVSLQAQTAGNRLATRVLAVLERRASVTARVRHRVHWGEFTLIGSGRYWQQGVGNLRKTRLVLQTQIAEQSASLVQLFDGRYLWTDRQFPGGRTVTRLDPVRLQAGLAGGESPIARQGRPTTATSLLPAAASRGSLCGQLADLIQRFDFEPPREIPWNGRPMVALLGYRKAGERERGGPESRADGENKLHSSDDEKQTREAPTPWPDPLPHHVLLSVGPQDLYPYVIEYRLADDQRLTTSPEGLLPIADPLARFEQFDVQFAAQIDDRLFELASGDISWTDETGSLIQQMRAWEQ